ncbi:hypothetical protein [Thermogemmatispora sp.]|uniref:hypothetical protein n=1 Tax=Thermogemmatispora sp. TaxID=1968838 RepID=UPI0035E4384A
MSSFNIGSLPNKPDFSNVDFSDPKAAIAAQQQQQEYWFAVNALQNAVKQEGEAKSNMQKSAAEALNSIIRNLA